MEKSIKSRYNVVTPWGLSDSATFWNESITQYGTPSHGGMKVCKELNEKIPIEFRAWNGWYEEDCAVHIVFYFLFEECKSISDYEFSLHYSSTKEEYFSKYNKEYCLDSIKRWYAAEWQVYSGENMEDSIFVNSWETKEKVLQNHNEKVSEVIVKKNAPAKEKIEVGKTIVFLQPVNYGSFCIEKAIIVKYKQRGKALRDVTTGKLCKIPAARELINLNYLIQ